MKTDIILVVDRSGSMMDIASDMRGGIAEFIKTQKEVSGKDDTLRLSVWQFDNEIEHLHDRTNLERGHRNNQQYA